MVTCTDQLENLPHISKVYHRPHHPKLSILPRNLASQRHKNKLVEFITDYSFASSKLIIFPDVVIYI
jgi:hypothetical protein